MSRMLCGCPACADWRVRLNAAMEGLTEARKRLYALADVMGYKPGKPGNRRVYYAITEAQVAFYSAILSCEITTVEQRFRVGIEAVEGDPEAWNLAEEVWMSGDGEEPPEPTAGPTSTATH